METEEQQAQAHVGGTPFAVVPEWVLYADISDRAARLYGILQRHVNGSEGYARPGRKRLMALLRCSERTLDAAMQELVQVGALRVVRRTRPGTEVPTANAYYLMSDNPVGVGQPVAPPAIHVPTVGQPTAPLERENLNDSSASTPSATTHVHAQLDLAGMPEAEVRAAPRKPLDPVWEAMCTYFGRPVKGSAAAGRRGKAVFDIRNQLLNDGVAPDDWGRVTDARCALAQRTWGARYFTDMAVAVQWSLLGRMLLADMAGTGGGLTAEDIWRQAQEAGR